MTKMKKPIDEFFDKVMVMVEDEKVRNNRLALLDDIGKLFLRIADFSKLT
jgi:glycyl-tRNA synthetase beta chain